MVLLDGKRLSEYLQSVYAGAIEKCPKEYEGASLSVIQIGDDKASDVYIRSKKRACESLGIGFQHHKMDKSVTTEDVVNLLNILNNDPNTTGIIVQLPIPKHLGEDIILRSIDPIKDVDCFNPENIGYLFKDQQVYAPCTPNGIMRMLDAYNVNISGKNCVIVGRSDIVGKPLALMMLHRDATVTVCHSKTIGLKEICKNADVLVCAIGKPKFFTKDYVKDGAVVIDVGINRDENNKLCGDVDFNDVKDIAGAITPVPGGVGPMTVSSLMDNCLLSARLAKINI